MSSSCDRLVSHYARAEIGSYGTYNNREIGSPGSRATDREVRGPSAGGIMWVADGGYGWSAEADETDNGDAPKHQQ